MEKVWEVSSIVVTDEPTWAGAVIIIEHGGYGRREQKIPFHNARLLTHTPLIPAPCVLSGRSTTLTELKHWSAFIVIISSAPLTQSPPHFFLWGVGWRTVLLLPSLWVSVPFSLIFSQPPHPIRVLQKSIEWRFNLQFAAICFYIETKNLKIVHIFHRLIFYPFFLNLKLSQQLSGFILKLQKKMFTNSNA